MVVYLREASDRRAVLWQAFQFTCFPTSPLARFDSSVFRVLLLRRLWQPLPPSSRYCRCGLLLDPLGQPGSLRWSKSVGSPSLRIGWKRDLDLVLQERVDGRRLEVVANWLPLFHGAQLAVDTTMVAPLKRDGTPQTGSVDVDGALVRPNDARNEFTLN